MDWNFVTHAAPLPSALPKFLALIYPFDAYVWGCFLICFVMICLALYLLCKLIIYLSRLRILMSAQPTITHKTKFEIKASSNRKWSFLKVFIGIKEKKVPKNFLQVAENFFLALPFFSLLSKFFFERL